MKKVKKTPKLRFPEFTIDWKEKKLKDIVKRITRKNTGNITSRPLTISAEMGLVDQEEYFKKQVASKNMEGYFLLKRNEFAYNKSYSRGYPYGVIKRLVKYDKGALSTLYICFKATDKVNKEYLDIYFESTYWHKEMFKIAVEGARNHGLLNISIGDFFDTKHKLPSLDEQKDIADFFKQLNKLVDLQRNKILEMEEFKKGMMQKLFPQKNKNKPELRFPGFTSPWKQCKLEELLTISKNRNKEGYYSRNDVLSVSREVGTVNQIEYQGRSFAGADISNYKVVQPGQIVYTKSPLKDAPYGIFQNVSIEGIVSPLYAVYNSTDKALATFIAFQLKNDNIATRYLSPLVSKGAKNTINISDKGALEGKVFYTDIAEQQKIIEYFLKLDEILALHQQKLIQIIEFKKGMMEKMFI